MADILSTSLPLALTIPKISDDIYWKRCYVERWPTKLPKDIADIEIEEIVKLNDIRKCSSVYSIKENGEDDRAHESVKDSRRSSRVSAVCTSRKKDDNMTDNKTWKEYYIEMHIKEFFENLSPENYNAEKVRICATFY